MQEIDKLMGRVGFKVVRSRERESYNRRLPDTILIVTEMTGKQLPGSLDDQILVRTQNLDGKRMGEPVVWTSFRHFIITMGGLNGQGTAN